MTEGQPEVPRVCREVTEGHTAWTSGTGMQWYTHVKNQCESLACLAVGYWNDCAKILHGHELSRKLAYLELL